jgi:putative transcriptional regulator
VSGPVLTNRIRELRQRQPGLTQEELARRCQVTRQTIIALEAGRYLPSLELAFRLARSLGAGVEEVFQWADEGGR